MINRVPRELGRRCPLHCDCRLELRLTNSRLIRSFVPHWRGRTGDERWYRQSKETKYGEMDGKESERSIVAVNRGNGPPDPVEQRGRRVMDEGPELRRGRCASKAYHRQAAWPCEGQRVP
jgi:hypothetical protein